MCGRYAIIDGKKVLESFQRLKVKDSQPLFQTLPRYNAAPTQRLPVFAVRHDELIVQPMQWWLVPHWSKDGKPSATTFNAKSETVAQSRLFSTYFKGSRCLVPAEAFYEWKKILQTGDGKAKAIEKQPICVRMKDDRPFMFAGIFSVWKNPEGEEHPSFSILTVAPNELVGTIHDRMPVILPEEHFEQWLDRSFKDVAKLQILLRAYAAEAMTIYPVSRLVNNTRFDGPECLTRLET